MKKIKLLHFIALIALFSFQTQAQLVAPENEGGTYYFNLGDVYFAVNANLGARISSFKLGDDEILCTENNLGSTFWTSPQAVWNWPPPENLDTKAYDVTVSENYLRMESLENNDRIKVQFVKEFYANQADTSITIKYKVINLASSAKEIAAWEITRVPSGGLMFFPNTGVETTGKLKELFVDINNHYWYDYDSTTVPGDVPKLFADSEGWMGFVDNNQNLFLKEFEDIDETDFAPDEAEVEYYCDPSTTYIELENQSAYITVEPDDTLTWEVKWYARKLPEDISMSAGNEALTSYVQSILSRSSSLPVAAEINRIPSFSVYPNPASSYINIQTTAKLSEVKIYDLSGRLHLLKSVNTTDNRIDISALKQGVYFIDINSEINRTTEKFVKL